MWLKIKPRSHKEERINQLNLYQKPECIVSLPKIVEMALIKGDTCPDFTLPNQHGEQFSMNTVLGEKIIVLYFYPKDDTPGCTAEACSFRDSYETFKDLGCEVIGISSDSISKHKAFAEKHRITFTLLADTDKKIRKLFDVPSSAFGLIPGRVTYIIDKNKKIIDIHNALLDATSHITKAIKVVQNMSDEK